MIAIINENNNNKKEGTNLCIGFLNLKWKYWAHIIKNAIKDEEKNNNSLYQMPITNIVAKDILIAPTMFLVRTESW